VRYGSRAAALGVGVAIAMSTRLAGAQAALEWKAPEGCPTEAEVIEKAGRLRFSASLDVQYGQWGSLQTSYPNPVSSTGYSCLPNASASCVPGPDCVMVDPASGAQITLDGTKDDLCDMMCVCACTATGCGVRDTDPAFSFDMFVTGDTASGSVAGGGFSPNNVHFTRTSG